MLQALVDFARKNPELVSFLWVSVLWPIASAAGNKLLDLVVPRAEDAFVVFEQKHPRVAAFAKLLRKLGVDPHALVARSRQVLNGKPPPLPPGFGVATTEVTIKKTAAMGDEKAETTETSVTMDDPRAGDPS